MITKVNKHHLDILIESEVNEPELTQSQIEWLNSFVGNNRWKYEDGVVNVEGSVDLNHNINLTSIPVQFGKVTGHFYCVNNSLTSLKGCPHEIGGQFRCWGNLLTSLEYFPIKISPGANVQLMNDTFILNDKLFEDIKRINKLCEIASYQHLLDQLKLQVPIQFGITDKKVIDKIWQSYMNILQTGKNK